MGQVAKFSVNNIDCNSHSSPLQCHSESKNLLGDSFGVLEIGLLYHLIIQFDYYYCLHQVFMKLLSNGQSESPFYLITVGGNIAPRQKLHKPEMDELILFRSL